MVVGIRFVIISRLWLVHELLGSVDPFVHDLNQLSRDLRFQILNLASLQSAGWPTVFGLSSILAIMARVAGPYCFAMFSSRQILSKIILFV